MSTEDARVTDGVSSLRARASSVLRGEGFRQLIPYGLVSAVALAVDASLFLALLSWQAPSAAAATLGYLAGLALHFVLSSRLVFDARRTGKDQPRLLAEFAASGLAGLAITAATVAVAIDWLGIGAVPAKAAATGLSFFAVFLLRRHVVFAPERR